MILSYNLQNNYYQYFQFLTFTLFSGLSRLLAPVSIHEKRLSILRKFRLCLLDGQIIISCLVTYTANVINVFLPPFLLRENILHYNFIGLLDHISNYLYICTVYSSTRNKLLVLYKLSLIVAALICITFPNLLSWQCSSVLFVWHSVKRVMKGVCFCARI